MAELEELEPKPEGDLTLSVNAEPMQDPYGTGIQAWWIVRQMECAALKATGSATGSNAVTVAIEAMDFVSPVKPGATVNMYTELKGAGRTSIKVYVEVWVTHETEILKVTDATFVLVAVDEMGRARPINQH